MLTLLLILLISLLLTVLLTLLHNFLTLLHFTTHFTTGLLHPAAAHTHAGGATAGGLKLLVYEAFSY